MIEKPRENKEENIAQEVTPTPTEMARETLKAASALAVRVRESIERIKDTETRESYEKAIEVLQDKIASFDLSAPSADAYIQKRTQEVLNTLKALGDEVQEGLERGE